jgi:hypothetical protein
MVKHPGGDGRRRATGKLEKRRKRLAAAPKPGAFRLGGAQMTFCHKARIRWHIGKPEDDMTKLVRFVPAREWG